MLKRKIVIIVSIVLTLCSCTDWLDLDPNDSVVKQEFWRNKEDVHSAVIGVYTSMLNDALMSKMIYWGELRGDMMTASTSANARVSNIIKGEISIDNALITWDEFYTTVNQCNDVLANASGVLEKDQSFTESALKQYEAEVLTVRALMYFYLVRSFKDVPFVTEASESDLQEYNIPKMDGTEILKSLAAELQGILNREELPITYGDNDSDKGRVTRWMAMALLADIHLWLENYSECNTLCGQIIGSGYFSLIPVSKEEVEIIDGGVTDTVYHVSESDVNNLFDQLYVTGNSIESIFEIQYPKTDEVLKDPFFTLFSSNTNQVLISNNEIVSTVIFPEYTGTDSEVFDIRSNTFSYRNGYVWKWIGLSRSEMLVRPQRTFPHWIVYRYPEILLMKAEALTQMAIAESNDQGKLKEAAELVRQIRDRANAIEDSESDAMNGNSIQGKSLEQLILSERARELSFEGKRWYDVLRHAKRGNFSSANNIYLQNLAINAAPSDKVASLLVKYKSEWFCYWPIPLSAMETNPNLIQNDFYKE